jgi:signal peptidase I
MNEPVPTTPQPGWLQRVLIGRHPKRTLLRAGLTAIALLIVFRFVLIPVRVTGGSMEPTYRDGSVNLINRLVFWVREPRRGDVVSVRTSGMSNQYLKRVIGVPGENFAITNGLIFINGRPLAEPYVKFREPWNLAPLQLGPADYVVIGDNRGMRLEDHTAGITQRRKLIGKPLL